MIDDATLNRIPFAAALTTGARRELAARGVLRRFPAGSVLFRAGDPGAAMYVILDGCVRVLGGLPGRAHVVHTERAGGSLGEVPALDGGPYPATAEAVESTTCIAFTAGALHAAITSEPSLAMIFIARLAGRVRVLVDRIESQAARRLPERLAALILKRHRETGAGEFTIATSQTAVAEELGTVREVVVRMLADMRRDGLIRSAGRSRVAVLDVAALQRLAGVPPQRGEVTPAP